MFHFVFFLLFVLVFKDVCLIAAWDPANFTFNPGDNYELVWQDEFENVGPVKAIINGQPAYAPNPKNWAYTTGLNLGGGIQNCTDSIENSYVQNGQLKIVAIKEGYTSAMLNSQFLQEFTFGVFAAKIRLPYGAGIWPAWWMEGNGVQYGVQWPTGGEIDIVEMWGGKDPHYNDRFATGTVHWNNASNTMYPMHHQSVGTGWKTPDDSMLHNNSLVYWSEWTPTTIKIGVNEFIFSVFNTTNIPESINPVWAFSGVWPYYLILDIFISKQWPSPPDNTTVWPQEMVVDWVRVYQRSNP